MESKQIQICLNSWIEAFCKYTKKYGENLDDNDFLYPSNQWDYEDWYHLQVSFEDFCGIERDWMNDCVEDNYYGYKITDRKKFTWAMLNFSLKLVDM